MGGEAPADSGGADQERAGEGGDTVGMLGDGKAKVLNTSGTTTSEPVLVIGRIVHYRDINGDVVPAIVTRVRSGGSMTVDLTVLHFNKQPYLATTVVQGDGFDQWFWPAR